MTRVTIKHQRRRRLLLFVFTCCCIVPAEPGFRQAARNNNDATTSDAIKNSPMVSPPDKDEPSIRKSTTTNTNDSSSKTVERKPRRVDVRTNNNIGAAPSSGNSNGNIKVESPSNNIKVESPNWAPEEMRRKRQQQPGVSLESDFMDWCKQVLGIQTVLEIQNFEYYDFFRESMEFVEDEDEDDEYNAARDDDAFYSPTVYDIPMIETRGLAACKNIAVGDVVISIPFHAMITVSTTIDHDPVLSQLMGPQAREAHGWDDAYYELPLLTVAILYHRKLGRVSPLYHYLQILISSPTDSMPFLWDRDTLRREATEGVQRIARGIKRDVREMYNAVMSVLLENHSKLFAEKEGEDVYMYSFEMFQWAFALVNSRHWHLPIRELDDVSKRHVVMSPTVSAGVPPAETPTEEWVKELDEENVEENNMTARSETTTVEGVERQGHSFMVPVADLLNFGPPCTRGAYNSETKRFELIATCPFIKGQEVTFWYSDDCEDAIMANYGFTHPMVPRCMSRKDWRNQSDLWKKHAEGLEKDLLEAYQELDRLEDELKHAKSVVENCGDCDLDDDLYVRRESRNTASRDSRDTRSQLGQETGVRGSVRNLSDREEKRERRKWRRSIKSSL